MRHTPDHVEPFEAHRDRLCALAYRMLGTRSGAEDVVQEAFLRWTRADPKAIDAPGAYLTRIVTNLSIDELRSAHRQRQEYIGPWLPEPIATGPGQNPAYRAELADSLSMAFLRLLETLTPSERAVFLLREIFGLDYEEIAEAVDETPVNCRQLASRARRRLQNEGAPRFDASEEERDRLMRRFEEAVRAGDLGALKDMLAEDIALYADGGGKAAAARRPLHGVDEVSRFLLGLERTYADDVEHRRSRINGEPGRLTLNGGTLYVWSFHIEASRIQSIFVVANPDKLAALSA